MIYGGLYYFVLFAEHKFVDFPWKFIPMIFSNKSMFKSAYQIKKIDLDDYVFNHQWFIVTNIVLHNLDNTNSIIFPTKTSPDNSITDYQQKKKKKRKRKRKWFLQAFTRNLSWNSLSCLIYRTSTDHALVVYVLLKSQSDYLSDKISFQ